jgi:hypothetical protein
VGIKVANDATIVDIVTSLKNPAGYVRGVLANMADYRKEQGTAVVRIGTTGQGVVPHYRIQREHSTVGELVGFDDEAGYFMAFHGSNHERLEWGSAQLRGEHWSTRALTFEEVQALLGKLRGFTERTPD